MNVDTALAAYLEGHYTFDGGNADNQSAGSSQNGTLNGNASIVADGDRGNVLSLDGSDDFVQITGLFDEPEDVTLAAWINRSDSGSLDEVISLGDNIGIRATSSSLSLFYYTSSGSNFVTLAEPLSDGWHHVAATFDDVNDTVTLYLNGEAVATQFESEALVYNRGTNTFIGRHGNGVTVFDFGGKIDDARIYTRSLSADEIAALATDQTEATDSVAITVTDVNDAPTFESGDGIETTAFGVGDDSGSETVVLPNGEILVVGSSNNGSDDDFAIARYNSDGSLDTSFGGGNGFVVTTISGGDDYASSVAVQQDGKILLSGTNDATNDFVVVRYDADGTLDTSFGTAGIVTTDISGGFDNGYDLLVQQDGKVVVLGTHDSGDSEATLIRYNSDGSLDASFGTGGIVTTSYGTDDAYTLAATLQADGKILITGFAGGATNDDVLLARYNTDGTLDTTFGSGSGFVLTAVGTASDYGYAVATQDDGKIVVAGPSFGGSDSGFTILRYNADGTLDTSFSGGDGIATTTLSSGYDIPNTIVVQSDGKLVVSGSTENGSDEDVAVVRYNSDGTLDTSFGTGGIVTIDVASGNDYGYLALQEDGKLVLAGSSDHGANEDVLVIRLNSDGSFDNRFSLEPTLDGNPTFVEGGSPVILDADVKIFDAELSALDNFNEATIYIGRDGGANPEDVFSATGLLGPLTEGSNLVFNSVTVGSVILNSGGELTLQFNSSATNDIVNSVMQSLAYSNSSDTPASSVDLNWTFNDVNSGGAQGTGGAQWTSGITTVNIQATADLAITAPTTSTTNEDTAIVYSGANVIQVDDGITTDSPIRVELAVANGTLNLAGTTGVAFVEGADGSTSMVIEGLKSDINAALDGLTFTPNDDYHGVETLNISTGISADLEGQYTFEGGNADDQAAGTAENGTFGGNATTSVDGTRGEVLSLDGLESKPNLHRR
ncbi:MAG: LamG-like jellyroll fold domain-containing protein, partial [Planctomycetota bacterium]